MCRQKENTENDNQKNSQTQEEKIEAIEKFGETVSDGAKHFVYCLNIIGQIEGHTVLSSSDKTTKYEHIIPSLVSIEQDRRVEGLIIMLNTVGGDVEAGLAIAEVVAGMKTPTVSVVVGGGHSIGVPLAVCAKHSFIVPSATMTVHPVRMNGTVLGVPQTMAYFQRMEDRIVEFVTRNSSISEDRYRELTQRTGELMMDVGTVLDGKQAVKEGLIDEVGSLSNAIEWLYSDIENSEKPSYKLF